MQGVGLSGRLFDSLARAVSLLAVFGLVPDALANDAGEDFRILYFEPLTPLPGGEFMTAQKKGGESTLPRTLSFDAYGRRFDLSLERNGRVMQDANATAIAYRGSLTGQPDSWARLTSIGDELHGLVWDGNDLYVIEPVGEAREFMVVPLAPTQDGNLIYRLSDTLMGLGTDFCDATDISPDALSNGLEAFKATTSDLKAHAVIQQAAGATSGLRISVLADGWLRTRYPGAAELNNALQVRLNNVDGIFSAQLGVEIQVTGITLYDRGTDGFSDTLVASELLDELGLRRSNSPSLRQDGLTHLFTGRDLDGQTVGIAYIDTLCRTRYGAGLTEIRGRGAALEALVTAHEIGHNFGAIHDGSGVCASTPNNLFIMAPSATEGNSTFSSCSLSAMTQSVSAASCIATLPPADLAIELAPVPAPLLPNQRFTWSVLLRNAGGRMASEAVLQLTLPAALTVEGVSVPGASCSSGAGVVECSLGNVGVNESRTVTLELNAQSAGSFVVTAVAQANNETNTANNTASATFSITAAAATAPVLPPPASGTPAEPPTGNNPVAANTGSGGGGGTMECLPLLLLGLLSLLRRRVPAAN